MSLFVTNKYFSSEWSRRGFKWKPMCWKTETCLCHDDCIHMWTAEETHTREFSSLGAGNNDLWVCVEVPLVSCTVLFLFSLSAHPLIHPSFRVSLYHFPALWFFSLSISLLTFSTRCLSFILSFFLSLACSLKKNFCCFFKIYTRSVCERERERRGRRRKEYGNKTLKTE